MSFSVVEYYGEHSNSRCGYCDGVKSNFAHGMHAHILTPQDYQDLIDRGWRRSGLNCYKPNNRTNCCKSYTIKCDAQEFKLSKSHKKVLRRINKFLTDGLKEKGDDDKSAEDVSMAARVSIKEEIELPNIKPSKINVNDIKTSDEKLLPSSSSSTTNKEIEEEKINNEKESKKPVDQVNENEKDQFDSKPPRKKAKQIRLERKKLKLEEKGISMDDYIKTSKLKKLKKNHEKSLQDYIHDVPKDALHKLKLKLINVRDKEFEITLKESYNLYVKYQTKIHNDPPTGTEEYLQFLQETCIMKIKKPPGGPPDGYGTFHQQYWLDDKLIAVGVMDILPYCVSSVYFFYDPDYSFLSLGTYSVLREIEFTQQLSEIVHDLKFYYMGYYIHSCMKMRYKCKFYPSYLLCPEVYTWHLITDVMKSELDKNAYQRLNIDPFAKDENEFSEENDLDGVLILFDPTTFARYGKFKTTYPNQELKKNIIEYGKLVGKLCARRMLYVCYDDKES